MAAKGKYSFALNLGSLGLHFFLSSFEIAIGKENLLKSFDKTDKYAFSVGYLEENLSSEKSKEKNKDDIFLTLKIFADKQYDYDQNIYIAEGNVKVIVNGGILRSDLLKYEKLNGILTAEGNVRFTKGEQRLRGKKFIFNLLKNEGTINEVFGILNINNVINDLAIDSKSEETILKNGSENEEKK